MYEIDEELKPGSMVPGPKNWTLFIPDRSMTDVRTLWLTNNPRMALWLRMIAGDVCYLSLGKYNVGWVSWNIIRIHTSSLVDIDH